MRHAKGVLPARVALAALAAFLTFPAYAAEPVNRMPRVAAPVQAVQPEDAPNWHRNGFQVTALAGYSAAILEAEGFDLANGKLMAGGAVGYKHRMDRYVVGVEADWLFTDISAASTLSGVTVSAANRHLASVRAIAGIPLGPVLFYATGGPAWQHARVKASDGVDSATDSVWQLGWVAGGGIEAELSRTLSVRLEALHYEFRKGDSPFEAFETEQNVIRAGLSFKLN